jgi:hypothetical protein
MYQLTIDGARVGTVVTSHTDRLAAWNALQRYAVDADVYLHTIQATEPHSSYDLVELTDRPRIAGCAVIEQMPAAAEALYYRALEARRWIDQHRTDPTGCPFRILARARAAAANPAANPAASRSLLQEAAALADVYPAPDVDPIILGDLAHQVSIAAPPLSAADLAGIVVAAETSSTVAAILTWWLALLTWAGLPS